MRGAVKGLFVLFWAEFNWIEGSACTPTASLHQCDDFCAFACWLPSWSDDGSNVNGALVESEGLRREECLPSQKADEVEGRGRRQRKPLMQDHRSRTMCAFETTIDPYFQSQLFQ